MYTLSCNLSSFEVQTDLFQFICNMLFDCKYLHLKYAGLTQITHLLMSTINLIVKLKIFPTFEKETTLSDGGLVV